LPATPSFYPLSLHDALPIYVGATVVDGNTLLPISSIQSGIERRWPGQFVIRKKLAAIQGLSAQEVPQQRRCSFYYDENTDISEIDRKSTRLNSSHVKISYAV